METRRDPADALAAGQILLVASGAAAGTSLDPAAELLLGREAEGEGRLGGDPQLSRRHARIVREDDGSLVVEDLGSKNGTFVNGVPIAGPCRLSPGDVLLIGETRLEVQAPPSAPPTRAAAVPAAPVTAAELEALPAPVEQAGSPTRIGRLSTAPAPAPAAAAAPAAELLHGGRRFPIPPEGLTIGRGETSGLVLDSPSASREHARIAAQDGRHFVSDLGSANGTDLNGERLHGTSRWLNPGDSIVIGGETIRYVAGAETRLGRPSAPLPGIRVVRFAGERLTIGRDPSNDVELPDPNVSRFHAELVRANGAVELRDLDSTNGTRVDGRLVARERLRTGSEVGIGPFRLVFDGEAFVQRDDRGAVRLAARDVTIAAKGRTILNGASLAIEPGEFLAVIGESGSGKSTLVKALAGVTPVTGGSITASGDPVATRLTDIGYLPQDEIVHGDLTILEALRYSARLRLPRDATREDLEAAVQRVVAELSLEPHVGTRIGSLSGGQRKRVGLAVELLNRPSLLFLDEPTSGLDPGLETRMMELFRALASEGARAVTVVTHATKNLELADKVCVMGRGGELAFFGAPRDATRFFGVESYDGIYTALDERPAAEWRRDFDAERRLERQERETDAAAEVPVPGASAARKRRPGRQAWVLARRYSKILTRDRRNLLILLGQVPFLAVAVAFLFPRDVLDAPGQGQPAGGAVVVFLLIISAIWIGAIDAVREIVKERALAVREKAVGVRVRSYLASKAIVLSALVAVQVAVLTAIVLVVRPLDEPIGSQLLLLAVVIVTALVAVGMGLFVSAAVTREDQAMSSLPLLVIPQVLFAGAFVTVASMPEPIQTISNAIFARWGFAAAGNAADMNARIAGDPQYAQANPYGPDFFELDVWKGFVILGVFGVVFFAAVAAILVRRRA